MIGCIPRRARGRADFELMKGPHRIKTWCSTQGALAMSSAEAEFYSMVEGVLRGYEMIGLSGELEKRSV